MEVEAWARSVLEDPKVRQITLLQAQQGRLPSPILLELFNRAFGKVKELVKRYTELGVVLGVGEFDWPGAEREFRRALELNPSSAIVRFYYAGDFLRVVGRVEEALTEMRRALELDPLDPLLHSGVGHCLHVARQFEPTVAQLQHAIDLDPTFFFPYWLLSIAYAVNGRLDQAIAAAEKANELSGGNAMTLGMLGNVYGRAGRAAEARQLLEELTARRRVTMCPRPLSRLSTVVWESWTRVWSGGPGVSKSGIRVWLYH